MNLVLSNLRAAVRAALRRPGATALAAASVGLAVGFSTAAFSILDAYALRELPVREPRRLARVYVTGREGRFDVLSWPEYLAVTSNARQFEGLATESRQGPRVKLPDRDDFPITAGVSDNYFDLLGVKAAQGDVFHSRQLRESTLVITDHYWQTALGGDPNVIGRNLMVGRAMLTIAAVLPPGFTGTNRGILVDLFVPPQTFFGTLGLARSDDIRHCDYEVVGRLRPGVGLEQARAEVDATLRRVERDFAAPAPERRAAIESFTESGTLAKLQAAAVPLAVMILLVLIAAANLANLRLVENESRRHEVGIRLALGAGPGALARQHLAETLLVAALGTGIGLLVAAWLLRAAPALFYSGRRWIDFGIRMDVRTFAFSAGALAAVALLGAAIPLGDAWRRRIVPSLAGSRSTRPSRWMAALVVAQMSLATGATCSAALLWRSLQNVSAIRPAMDPNRRLLILRGAQRSPQNSTVEAAALAESIAGLPGVERCAWARRAPLSGSGGGRIVDLEMPGQPKLSFAYNQVSANYFATTGGRVIAGRPFAESDGPDATPVVLVNAAFTRRFPAGREPLGQWIRVGGRQRQIVGVVEDGPANHLKETPAPYFYFPYAQMPTADLTLLVETRRDPSAMAASVRKFARESGAFTLVDMTTMRQHMNSARSDELLEASVAGSLAVVALLLAAAGLFGVSLFAVARRTREFGVRVALGATPRALAAAVLAQAALRVAVALPLGWGLAWASRGALGKLLYGIAPGDPWTLAAAAALVAATAAVAALIPALRAARIDPVIALRHE
jgi:predicted permease